MRHSRRAGIGIWHWQATATARMSNIEYTYAHRFRAHSARSGYHGWYTIEPQYTGLILLQPIRPICPSPVEAATRAQLARRRNITIYKPYILCDPSALPPRRAIHGWLLVLCTRIVPHTMCSVRGPPPTQCRRVASSTRHSTPPPADLTVFSKGECMPKCSSDRRDGPRRQRSAAQSRACALPLAVISVQRH